MGRKLTFKPNDSIEKCPRCGNNTEFIFHSQQVCEDCCEVWAVCKCGFNPTEEHHGYRLEDVWGGCDNNNCMDAISCSWNEPILEKFQTQPDANTHQQ